MWFWINFSPIGQASPASKKTNDSEDEKDKDVDKQKKSNTGKLFKEKFCEKVYHKY